MLKKKLLLIINPKAGRKLAQGSLIEIIDRMMKAGYQVTVHLTQERGDAITAAKEAEGKFDRVVCCGGDGTLNETVSGLVCWQKRAECGYLPAGTTNDFANTLGFPKDPVEAAGVAVDGRPFACDIGRFDERYFNYIAAFGAFTSVSYSTDQQAKNIFGRLAYLAQGVKELSSLSEGVRMKVITDAEVIEDEFIFGGITNSVSIGGFQTKAITADDVLLDDGMLELILIRQPRSAADLSELVACLTAQKIDQQMIRYKKVRSATFIAEKPTAWTLDGEDGGVRTEVTAEVLPAAVTFIV